MFALSESGRTAYGTVLRPYGPEPGDGRIIRNLLRFVKQNTVLCVAALINFLPLTCSALRVTKHENASSSYRTSQPIRAGC